MHGIVHFFFIYFFFESMSMVLSLIINELIKTENNN